MTTKLHKSDWLKLIAEFKSSNMKRAEFCRIKNIDPAKFGYHYKVNRKLRSSPTVMPIKIDSAHMSDSSKTAGPNLTTIKLANGLMLSIPTQVLTSQTIFSIIMQEVNHVST